MFGRYVIILKTEGSAKSLSVLLVQVCSSGAFVAGSSPVAEMIGWGALLVVGPARLDPLHTSHTGTCVGIRCGQESAPV